jgi:hypothetical protein
MPPCNGVHFACLQEARGGEVQVREGVVSQRPAVTVQPADVTVDKGGNAQLSIIATVSSRATGNYSLFWSTPS